MGDTIQGIVIQSVRYGESSLVVKVFTRQFGLRSYMVKGAFGRSAKNRAALFQDLNVIAYVETGKPSPSGLGYLKDVQIGMVFRSLPFEMGKRAILMFASEMLSKTLAGHEQDTGLYDFVAQSLQWLDLVDGHYANFPVYFTLELTRHLGFYPTDNHRAGYGFDMMEGRFVADIPAHPYCLDAELADTLHALIGLGIDEACRLPLRLEQRRNLLDGLIVFMRLHAPVMNGFRSHEVLKEVLR